MAIHAFTSRIDKALPVTLDAKLMNTRDYLYIDDAIDAVTKCLGYKESRCETFNIGSGTSLRLGEVLRRIEKTLGRSTIETIRTPCSAAQLDHVRITCEKAAVKLGFGQARPSKMGSNTSTNGINETITNTRKPLSNGTP